MHKFENNQENYRGRWNSGWKKDEYYNLCETSREY